MIASAYRTASHPCRELNTFSPELLFTNDALLLHMPLCGGRHILRMFPLP